MSEDPENPYRVGYGKPPRETRFQPGQTGNAGGRPKKRKTAREVLFDELNRTFIKEINGEPVVTTVLEGLMRKALKQAATDPDYFLKLMRWQEGYNPPPAEPTEDERTFEFLKSLSGL